LLRVVLGITGGIAAYKIPLLIRALQKKEVQVKTVLTPNAAHFVGLETLRTLSHNPVYTDSSPSEYEMEHIQLADWGDCMVIAPATANTIAKIAHGIADNLLTSLALSFENRLLIAPAMNTRMWENSHTRANIAVCKENGTIILPVGEGDLACGVSGAGRMIEIEEIAESILAFRSEKPLKGKKVLIASGPTQEPIDPVRMITNRSSGKMGAALAQAAHNLGAAVTVVSGPARVALPAEVTVQKVESAREMLEAMDTEFDSAHICIMAAAVSDYRPSEISDEKLNRREKGEMQLTLIPNPDIAQHLGNRKKGQYLVCFALEQTKNTDRARAKMEAKNADMMILNKIDEALEKDTTKVSILSADQDFIELPAGTKNTIAASIMATITQKLNTAHD